MPRADRGAIRIVDLGQVPVSNADTAPLFF